MAASAKQRWITIGSALALTLAATGWVASKPGELSAVVTEKKLAARGTAFVSARTATERTAPAEPDTTAQRATHARNATVAASTLPAPGSLSREAHPGVKGDPFRSRSWETEAREQARKAEPPPPPPPPPQAPPLPFRYMGRLIEGGVHTVFVTANDRNYAIKPGDRIDDTWVVNEITERAVMFTYVPLDLKQQLSIATN